VKKRHRVALKVHFDKEQVVYLKQLAEEQRCSRAHALRELVYQAMKQRSH